MTTFAQAASWIVSVASLPREKYDDQTGQFRSVVGGTFNVLRSSGKRTDDCAIAEQRTGLDLTDPKIRAAIVVASGGLLTLQGSGFVLTSKVRAGKLKARQTALRSKTAQREARLALVDAIAQAQAEGNQEDQ